MKTEDVDAGRSLIMATNETRWLTQLVYRCKTLLNKYKAILHHRGNMGDGSKTLKLFSTVRIS